jgi:MoxR-like ATPase
MSNNDETNAALIEQSVASIKQLEQQINQAIVGQPQVVRELIVALIAAGHVLIEGVPGLGKTLLVKALAKATDSEFSRIQFTPDLMPNDITGHALYDMKTEQFKIRRGPVFCNFLLADEINRAPAKTQSALLEVMQEQQATIEGRALSLQQPFLVLATQNPIEHEGTYPLPEAQLDRFLIKLRIDYPSENDEKEIVKLITGGHVGDKLNVAAVKPVLSRQQIIQLQQAAATLTVDEQVIHYAVDLVRATRNWNGVQIGAGPRGSISLLRAARAQALYRGNDFVTPDDVKAIAPAVLRHRIQLDADLRIENYQPDDIIADILQNIAAPRQ